MTEIEELKAEIVKLREEVARLAAGQVVHHYHHGPSPLEYQPARSPTIWPQPCFPGYPYVTCGGETRFS
jgi:hypothetical protein